MAEGGLLSWKLQKINNRRGPAGNYNNLNRSLPNPPKDMHWVQDLDTKEWRLVKIDVQELDYYEGNGEDVVFAEDPLAVSAEADILATAQARPVESGTNGARPPEFYEHHVSPEDTFPGICLKYRLTPTELRRANGGFSGTNLLLAPNPLRIPVDPTMDLWKKAAFVPAPARTSPSHKMGQLQTKFPTMTSKEARCYLELNDWKVDLALANAREDGFQ